MEKIKLVIRDASPQERTAVLFSGGLDSTVLASLLSQHTRVKLYTVGKEGSFDMEMGRKTAAFLELPWNGLVVDHDQIIRGLSELISILPTDNPVVLSYELPLYLAALEIPEVHLFSGQGADELFGGYAKYVELSDGERETKMAEDLENLLQEGLLLEERIAEYHDKVIHYPFLDLEVRGMVGKLPMDYKIRGETRKVLLRDIARILKLEEVATRKKKAAQYGTGIMDSMRKEARRRNTGVRGLIEQLATGGRAPET